MRQVCTNSIFQGLKTKTNWDKFRKEQRVDAIFANEIYPVLDKCSIFLELKEKYILIESEAIPTILNWNNVTFEYGFQIANTCFLLYCPQEFNGMRHAFHSSGTISWVEYCENEFIFLLCIGCI
jgi:hypothetical protein